MTKPRIQWAVKVGETYGNALGYGTHSKSLLKELEKIVEITDDAHIAIHLTPAERFRYIPGKFNILFTMWEFLEIPNVYIANLNRADAVVVPCQFCKDIFQPYTNKPIYVCKEGIVPENYPFFQRDRQPKKFRFLWSGAPNQRKGYPFVVQAAKVFENYPNIEIYVKTTVENLSAETLINKAAAIQDVDYRKERTEAVDRILNRIPKIEEFSNKLNYMGKHNNILFDTRKLSLEELRDLYSSAHCFLLPTFGEGWGLTLCEALATGCPAIATNVTGVKDYFGTDFGFDIKYNYQELDIRQNYGIKTLSFIPDINDFIAKMILVLNNYDEALRRGKKASERIHKKFTWAISAQRLADIILEIEESLLCAK